VGQEGAPTAQRGPRPALRRVLRQVEVQARDRDRMDRPQDLLAQVGLAAPRAMVPDLTFSRSWRVRHPSR